MGYTDNYFYSAQQIDMQEQMSIDDAKKHCAGLSGCAGFTVQGGAESTASFTAYFENGIDTVHAAGCTASFTQWAGVAALEGPQDCVEDMLTEYRRRRDYVVSELNSMPGVSCETPQGAFYAFPDVSQIGLPAQQISDMILREAGVATLPGTDFGKTGEGHIRISYVTDMATLEKGMMRLKKFFTDIQTGKYADIMPIPPYMDYLSLGLSSTSADN